MEDGVYIIWPEQRWLRPDKVKTMFQDAIDNGNIEPSQDFEFDTSTVDGMARALHDIGLITMGRPR